jgi:acyl-CoA synthetase (AMP-forming)/AMP-acid ligase II
MRTVFEAFMATAGAAPDHAFLAVPAAPGRAYHPDGVEFSYGRTRAETLRLRDVYAAAGYGHGHRVALLLENRPEFFFHYLALNALGCGIVPINPTTGTTRCATRWTTPRSISSWPSAAASPTSRRSRARGSGRCRW